jgi:hypothetical protein
MNKSRNNGALQVVRVFQPLRVVRSIAASVFAHEPAVAGEAPEAAALPAYEHQIAHHVLKRILEVEAEMEAKDQSADQHLELREGNGAQSSELCLICSCRARRGLAQ